MVNRRAAHRALQGSHLWLPCSCRLSRHVGFGAAWKGLAGRGRIIRNRDLQGLYALMHVQLWHTRRKTVFAHSLVRVCMCDGPVHVLLLASHVGALAALGRE